MDRLLAPTKDDVKMILKSDYRKRQEQIRKVRIFNPKQRLIGIDKIALDQLVEEKQRKTEMKQKEEICFALEQNRLQEVIDAQVNEARADKLRVQCELIEFRSRFQQRERARENDLSDPLYVYTKSAADNFDWLGLDPDVIHRKKMQQEQQISWLNQQMHGKMLKKIERNKAETAIEKCASNQKAGIENIVQTKEMQRRKDQLDTAKFNQSLAQARKQKQLEDKRHEEEDNLSEIMNNLCSDMLTENKETGVCLSLFGGSRVIPTMYRGMTEDQLNEIRQVQLQQIKDKQSNSTEQKKKDDLLFDENVEHQLKFEFENQEIEKERNQMHSLQNLTNMKLHSQQKQRNQYLNENVYKFTPTEFFFNQFNTTTR